MSGNSTTDYYLEEHKHRFAAWAAGRAASTSKTVRFSVEDGKHILEAIGLNAKLARPDQLPSSSEIDVAHGGGAEKRSKLLDYWGFPLQTASPLN